MSLSKDDDPMAEYCRIDPRCKLAPGHQQPCLGERPPSDDECLLRMLVDQLLLPMHPLPWHIEHDWTWEVHDERNKVVLKCQTAAQAERLIKLAQETHGQSKNHDL